MDDFADKQFVEIRNRRFGLRVIAEEVYHVMKRVYLFDIYIKCITDLCVDKLKR